MVKAENTHLVVNVGAFLTLGWYKRYMLWGIVRLFPFHWLEAPIEERLGSYRLKASQANWSRQLHLFWLDIGGFVCEWQPHGCPVSVVSKFQTREDKSRLPWPLLKVIGKWLNCSYEERWSQGPKCFLKQVQYIFSLPHNIWVFLYLS